MKRSSGITMITLVITIVVLLIIAGISIETGSGMIKKSELENLKTDMLLIKVKGKEYVENANFNLGTSFDKLTDENEKNTRLEKAKENLKGTQITDISELNENFKITESQFQEEQSNLIFYYKLSTQDLNDMGLSNVKSDDKNGWFIIKYDIKNIEIEIYNEKGFENENTKYYSSNEIENLYI